MTKNNAPFRGHTLDPEPAPAPNRAEVLFVIRGLGGYIRPMDKNGGEGELSPGVAENDRQGERPFCADFRSELRVRASSVVGLLDLLLLSGLTPKQKKYAELARASGKELLAMIEQEDVPDTQPRKTESTDQDIILDPSVERKPRLIELFFKHLPKYLTALEQSIETEDAKEIEARAHKIKGSCLAFGAPAMAKLSMKIETLGRNGDLEPVPRAFAHLQREFQKVRELMDTIPEQ